MLFLMVLSDHNEIQRISNVAGKYLLPLHVFFFDLTVFVCQPIFKNFAAHFATN